MKTSNPARACLPRQLSRREQKGASRAGVLGGVAVIVAGLLIAVLSAQRDSSRPYDLRSTAPDGYAALGELLRRNGAEVRSRSLAAAVSEPIEPGDVVFVPLPELASASELRALEDAAASGAVVVYGREPVSPFDPEAPAGVPLLALDHRILADTPAQPVAPGRCDIWFLEDLGDVDGAFTEPVPVDGRESCYGSGGNALVVYEPTSAGALITLGGPELLVNARLQPAKEEGGRALDNAALALRLFGPEPDGVAEGVTVTFVDPVSSAGAPAGEGRNPIDLLPLGLRLALAMGIAAFVLYAWFRALRLGGPIREKVPVEIAGSELVAAVGDLLRRKGGVEKAAASMRADVRRTLAHRLGVPPGAPPERLAAVVAARTGSDPRRIRALLGDDPVGSAEGLIRLAHSLDDLRTEVLNEPAPR